MRYWITPSLAVSDEPDVLTPDEATDRIQGGDDGLVGSIEDAYEVLHNLGLSDDEIRSKVDFAFGL